jgi:hypothetical protein
MRVSRDNQLRCAPIWQASLVGSSLACEIILAKKPVRGQGHGDIFFP